MEQMSTAGLTATLRWRRGLALRSQTARGDDAALAAMYERHHQALYRYCRSILHDDEDARDALQSTMAKALAALRDEERDFELRPWLFRIAHNEAISRLRQRRDSVDLDAVGTLGADSLAQTVEDRERLALLRADLRDLPERQRSALVLRELSGLSHEEIAVVLDSSAGAVKQTIFEARAGLHECAEGRTMLCADVQRALSDGDGRVLRGRRIRAHIRSCRACRTFKTALAQRPADLAALAPALPATAGAALLAHLLPGAKAGLASSAGTAAGAGGGMAATVAGKVAIVAVATATLAGTGTVVRDAATAPHRSTPSAPSAPVRGRSRRRHPRRPRCAQPRARRSPEAGAPTAGTRRRPPTAARRRRHAARRPIRRRGTARSARRPKASSTVSRAGSRAPRARRRRRPSARRRRRTVVAPRRRAPRAIPPTPRRGRARLRRSTLNRRTPSVRPSPLSPRHTLSPPASRARSPLPTPRPRPARPRAARAPPTPRSSP
jgi:RNA polymerase sigma factor (sigma-70 family)